MGRFTATTRNHLVVPARVSLTDGQAHARRSQGQAIPGAVAVRLLIDTGSKRTTLIPGIIAHLNPVGQSEVRVETSLATGRTELFWIQLEFPGTSLATIPELAVARLQMPPSLATFHGLLGRDLLFRWYSFLLEGQRGRFTLRDEPGRLSRWLRRWF